jgi:nucleotide-binding universal stress UspA family protein
MLAQDLITRAPVVGVGGAMSRRSLSRAWRRIVAGTDFSPKAGVAIRSAEMLARGTGAEIVLLHVLEVPTTTYAFGVETLGLPDIRETWAVEARQALSRTASRLRRRGVATVETEVQLGRPWEKIVQSARAHAADLVVLGSSGRSSFERLLLGSTAENVVRHSPVPVLVTRGRPLGGLRRVLVPIAFDEGSRAAVAFARAQLPRSVELEAFHAALPVGGPRQWDPVFPPSIPLVTKELRKFLTAAGAKRMRLNVEEAGDATSAILRRAKVWKADLILLSTHGRGGFSHLLLGSVAEKVARYADCAVLVLPPPDRAARTAQPSMPGRRPRALPVKVKAEKPRPRPPGRKGPGPWTGQAHTGRGGPAGRRGAGSKAGTKTHR